AWHRRPRDGPGWSPRDRDRSASRPIVHREREAPAAAFADTTEANASSDAVRLGRRRRHLVQPAVDRHGVQLTFLTLAERGHVEDGVAAHPQARALGGHRVEATATEVGQDGRPRARWVRGAPKADTPRSQA